MYFETQKSQHEYTLFFPKPDTLANQMWPYESFNQS